MVIRRLVTGIDRQGNSVFTSIGIPPKTGDIPSTGYRFSTVWATSASPQVPVPPDDPTLTAGTWPGAGGTTLVVVTMPPENMKSGAADAAHRDSTDGVVYEANGMHTTDTVDYIIMLDGRLWAELDNGRGEELKPGDILIQNGTRHAWRNRSDKPATFAACLIGANRQKRSS
jgi:hypothetical protein